MANPQLDIILLRCLSEIIKLPGFEELELLGEPKVICEKIKSAVIKERKDIHEKIVEIHTNLTQGKYDEIILSENPAITEELEIAKTKYSREFIQILFVKCKSDRVLRFWLDEQNLELPKDTWALAVNLGANIAVLKYLKDKGFYNGLSQGEKSELLIRANRFPGEGLNYLKQEFSTNTTLRL